MKNITHLGARNASRKDPTEVKLKRYRYIGKESDEETGLYYHGARYYAPWLGKWISLDPAGTVEGSNLYGYVNNNPLRHNLDGRQLETPWDIVTVL